MKRAKIIKRDYRAWRLCLSAVLLAGVVALALVARGVFAQVWSEPTTAPPGANAPAPIWNQIAAAQTGNFWISGNGYLNGSVGIGTQTPNNKLQVAGLIDFNPITLNTYLGMLAGTASTSGSYNVAIGYQALTANTTGNRNTAVGSFALPANTTGTSNTALGTGSLYINTTGQQNTAVGDTALGSNTTGAYNAAFSYFALRSSTTANYNTALGNYALGSLTTGSNNTAIGYNAANTIPTIQTVSNSTFVGAGASSSVDGVTNSTAIGNDAQVTASNQVSIGNYSVTATLLHGVVTANGVGVCLADGTNCPSAGGGGSSGRLYLTRASLAYNATTAQKDSQCQAEFGTNSVNASSWDVIANFGATEAVNSSGLNGLVSDGSYLVYSGTSWGAAAPTNLAVMSIYTGTSKVWCVPKTNNLIFTRTRIAYNSSVAAKDSQCSSEWGGGKVWGASGSYRAGSIGDIQAAWSGATGYTNTVIAYTSANNSYLNVANAPSQIAEGTIGSGTGTVGCIRYPAQ